MMSPIPAVVPPLPRERTWKRNVAPAAALDWLSAGWRDFTIDPAASISYGLLVFLVSVVTTVGLFALRWDYILLPAFAGFMVVGPIIGIGLYEKAGASQKVDPSTCGRWSTSGRSLAARFYSQACCSFC